jgi:hypothetical protein
MTGPNRDDLDREEAVGRLLRRPAQGVHIPPFAAVQARLTRRTSFPVIVLATTAALVVALVVGGLLAERRSRVAEPEATPPLTSASPAVTGPASTPATATILNDRFGFVWSSQAGTSGVNIQPETGQGGFALPTQPYRFSGCSCAVSPDGTRVAYWAGSTPGTIELRIVDVARPGLGTAIYKAPADRRWTALAWSSDGSGILFSLEDWGSPGAPVGGPSGTSLLVIEATGGAARTLATGDGAYVPLGWDRATGVAAAGLSGEGGYMTGYIIARTNGDPAPQRTGMPGQILMGSVRVSADQRFVLGVFSDQGTTLRWWKLADPGVMVKASPIAQNIQPTWRPLSTQIGWVESGTLQFLDVERGLTSTGGTLPPGDYSTVAFRVDGSAVAVVGTSYVLLDISSGRSVALASPGYIVGSVRF